jgi:adenylosuccinate lyase
MSDAALHALSPIDGRYAAQVDALRGNLSEAALIIERIKVEAEWLLHLVATQPEGLSSATHLAPAVLKRAQELADAPPEDAARAVKDIERRTNHDVKAVEYYLREQLQLAGADDAMLELVHFGCTSEDINNLAYARMLRAARETLLTNLESVISHLKQWSESEASLGMLSRTHGQTASPTTLGKEIANVAARLTRATDRWREVEIFGKWNGAVGNFNAHVVAVPAADWPSIARAFVEGMGLRYQALTTQIEPHDWIAEYCDALAGLHTIGIDFARDVWGYISLGYLRQRAIAGEVGSSTMPHKVNPIDFENAEGNFGIANALLRYFADKLPISRWQRDLTDSTVLRNLGVAMAHSLIAWRALQRGLGKVDAYPDRIADDLQHSWEVLGEAVQTVLRAEGVANGYELLKDLTRGQSLDATRYLALVESLPIPEARKTALAALRPHTYLGLASTLAQDTTDDHVKDHRSALRRR